MNEARAARLEEKYNGTKIKAEKKQIELGPRGRNSALRVSGKPKNLKASIVRLMKYVSQEKVLIVAAILCSLLYTISSLAASYLLRPIINNFIYFDEADPDLGARIRGLVLWLLFLAVIYGISVLTH